MSKNLYTTENSQYSKNHPNWHMEDSKWKAEQILKMLKNNPLNLMTIAEIGCGAGEILNHLHSEMPDYIQFTGYDISPDAISFAKRREKKRLEFLQEDMLENKKRFDLLLMMDVFEHIEDYMGFLKASKSKSKNTIFHIPLDISVEGVVRKRLVFGRNRGGHLHYFTKETALATLTDCGYEIIDFCYTAGMLELPKKSLKSKIAYFPRKLVYTMNKDFAARLFGGFSLLVLTK